MFEALYSIWEIIQNVWAFAHTVFRAVSMGWHILTSYVNAVTAIATFLPVWVYALISLSMFTGLLCYLTLRR